MLEKIVSLVDQESTFIFVFKLEDILSSSDESWGIVFVPSTGDSNGVAFIIFEALLCIPLTVFVMLEQFFCC